MPDQPQYLLPKPYQPSKEELKLFIETFHTLEMYEANQFILRGHAAFKRDENIPIPAINVVMEWLQYLAEYKI